MCNPATVHKYNGKKYVFISTEKQSANFILGNISGKKGVLIHTKRKEKKPIRWEIVVHSYDGHNLLVHGTRANRQ